MRESSIPPRNRSWKYRTGLRGQRSSRRALSLLELTLSLVAASVLLAGLASAVRISTRTLRVTSDTTRNDPLGALEVFQEDAHQALQLTSSSSSQLSLTVPDRNGDGSDESILYRISSNELQRAQNSTSYYSTGLSASGLAFSTQASTAASITPYANPTGRVMLQSYTFNQLSTKSNQMTLTRPANVNVGDLLVYAVAVQGNQTGVMAVGGTWQNIANQRQNSSLTMHVGWHYVTASEPATYLATWAGSQAACGYVVHVTGAHASTPIASSQARNGSAAYPQSGANPEPYLSGVTTAADLTVLRFIGFDRDALIGSTSGLSRNGHLPLLESAGSSPNIQLLGVLRQLNATTDENTNQFFDINTASPFVAVTVALRPAT